ncbi:MAG: hypothetical protein ACXWQQ_09390 [Pseudobdellovibrio sp.]
MKFFNTVLVGLLLSLTLTAQASDLQKIEIDPSVLQNLHSIPGASVIRYEKAVRVGYHSQLLRDSLKDSGMTADQLVLGQVYSAKVMANGAIELEIGFPFPENTDPCTAFLKVISNHDGTVGVQKTMVYNGAINGNVLGVVSCQD